MRMNCLWKELIMEKILTIIIPSYNTAEYIDKNIKTMLDERLFDDVEIMMINDGSKDDTSTIAHKYESLYPQCVKVVDKENGGHGSVINTGVSLAKGKYLKIIDGDDWVDTNALYKLVQFLKKTDADIVFSPYISHGEKSGSETLNARMDVEPETLFSISEFISKRLNPQIHTITVKKDIWLLNNIRVTEKCFYEDFQYANYPIPFVKQAAYLDFPVYYYLTEQKTQSVSDSSTYKNLSMFVKVYRDANDFFNSVVIKDCIMENFVEKQLITFLRQTYNVFLRNVHQEGIIENFKTIDAEIKEINSDRYHKLAEKYFYIRQMRKYKKSVFYCMSILFKVYKKYKSFKLRG